MPPVEIQTTADYLGRTVYVGTSVERSEEDLMAFVGTIKKVADGIAR